MQFTNTLSGKKEEFIVSKPLKMYVCGVTPYDDAHVGHGRCYVAFDVLYRMLRCLGIDVKYCRNFTDIDDKIMHRAHKELGDRLRYAEIANKYIAHFHEDIAKLNCVAPDYEPRVTENIPQIIDFIQKLIDKGDAYESNGDVYFRIDSFPDYGKLSKQKIEDLHAGARIDICEKKENPLDFALWKSEPEGEFWPSPWGYGRPGWHIECSVLARINLAEHIDIHGGGLDLIFPHHENEIAQSESLFGEPFSRMWMHNGMVNSNKEKMSKSLGNFFMLRQLYEHFDPMVIRYYFLTHHYRMPIEFSFEGLASAQKSYERLVRLCSGGSENVNLNNYRSDLSDHVSSIALATEEALAKSDIVTRMLDFLQDDLNTPGLLGVLFEHIAEIAQNAQELAAVKTILENILGLTLQPLAERTIHMTPEIELLIAERNKARHEKNWKRADELRDQLKAMGMEVQDAKL